MRSTELFSLSRRLVGYGLGILVLASVLFPIGLSYPMNYDPRLEPQAAAWEYLSTSYLLAHVALLIALVLLPIGLATIAYIAVQQFPTRASLFLFGVWCSIIGFPLLIPSVAVQGLALPAYAQAYVLTVNPTPITFRLASFGTNTFFFTLVGRIFLFTGAICIARGIHDIAVRPRWIGPCYFSGMLVLFMFGGFRTVPLLLGYGIIGQSIRIISASLIGIAGLGLAWWGTRYPSKSVHNVAPEQQRV